MEFSHLREMQQQAIHDTMCAELGFTYGEQRLNHICKKELPLKQVNRVVRMECVWLIKAYLSSFALLLFIYVPGVEQKGKKHVQ
mmetsp:Transcript_25784/g.26180  ORF Transcript_25784/g.26180 Transcript_25784/m.26180 type:complete len:84 (+) Transcript_25784:301-552(+)